RNGFRRSISSPASLSNAPSAETKATCMSMTRTTGEVVERSMVIMVVVVMVVLLDLDHARLDFALVEQPVGEQNVLECGQPPFVVPPPPSLPTADLRDELLPEALPLERVVVRERDGHAEGAALPGRVEDELAVRARRRRGALDVNRHGAFGSPV